MSAGNPDQKVYVYAVFSSLNKGQTLAELLRQLLEVWQRHLYGGRRYASRSKGLEGAAARDAAGCHSHAFEGLGKESGVRYFRNPCDPDPPTRNFKNFNLNSSNIP